MLKVEIIGDNVQFTRTMARMEVDKVEFARNNFEAQKSLGMATIMIRNMDILPGKADLSIQDCSEGIIPSP